MKQLPKQFSVYAKTKEEAEYICEKQEEICGGGIYEPKYPMYYRFSPNQTWDRWGYSSSSYLENPILAIYGINIKYEFTFEEFKSYFEEVNKNICFQSDGTKETGQKIIEELEKLGAINELKYDGSSNGRYYFINSKGNLDMEWDIPEGYELVNLNKEKIMKNRILTPANATRIINIACSTWKPKLAEKWATNIVLNKDTEISEEFYKEMRKACTSDQNILFDEIFGIDEQTIKAQSLKYGEAIKLTEGTYEGRIILRTFSGIVDIHNPENTWSTIPNNFVGKKVKLTITHEEIK